MEKRRGIYLFSCAHKKYVSVMSHDMMILTIEIKGIQSRIAALSPFNILNHGLYIVAENDIGWFGVVLGVPCDL